jgi:hypothetical protein
MNREILNIVLLVKIWNIVWNCIDYVSNFIACDKINLLDKDAFTLATK